MIKYYFVFLGEDMFLYGSNDFKDLKIIKTLRGCFIKNFENKKIGKVTYYSIEIAYSNNKKFYYYFEKEERRNKFLSLFKNRINDLDFKDYYDLLNTLGKGKYGVVNKCQNKKNKNYYAVKIMDKTSFSQKDSILITKEISVIKFVHHKNLVSLVDYFEDRDKIYIIMDMLEGGDLVDYINRNKTRVITENEVAIILREVARGIRYMNCYGLIHRDLKPENISFAKMNDINTIKLIDFGLATVLTNGQTINEVVGTVVYSAPEILKGSPYDKKCDVWSLGVIFYLLIGGRLPFDDPSYDNNIIMKKICHGAVEFPKDYFGNVSKACINLIDRCLEKNPIKRITIEDFLNDEWVKKMCIDSKNS